MKRISLEKLVHPYFHLPYSQQYNHIINLLKAGKIKPVKASGTNGKSPALYREYWVEEEKRDYSALEEELKFRITPLISIDFYLAHLDRYEKDRLWVLQLNDYLKNRNEHLICPESVNERSFEIWHREKFLSKEQGKRILKCCGLEPELLNMYETAEPLAYYSHTRQTPQNLLILENKDTFYSMRRHLLEGNDKILGSRIGTLIYGAGKRIIRSFKDFDICVEPYMKEKDNRIYYLGDLDYEGIGIYENLSEMFSKEWEIIPFHPGYEAMLLKAEAVNLLPDTKEQQNRKITGYFFSHFTKEQVDKMKVILEADRYIPQEILNAEDL